MPKGFVRLRVFKVSAENVLQMCAKGKVYSFMRLRLKLPGKVPIISFFVFIRLFLCTGKLKGEDTMVKGSLTLPYISEEHDDDKMEVCLSKVLAIANL